MLGICRTINLQIDVESKPSEYLASSIVDGVKIGSVDIDGMRALLDYFSKYAPKIESKSFGLKKEALFQLLGLQEGTKQKETTREQLIQALRTQVYRRILPLSNLEQQQRLFLKNRLSMIKKPEVRAYLGSKILGSTISDITLEDLVNLIESKLMTHELRDDDVERLIKGAQTETVKGKRNTPKDYLKTGIEQRLDALSRDIQEIKQVIKKLEDRKIEGYVREYRPETGRALDRLIRSAKISSRQSPLKTEDFYDRLLTDLRRSSGSEMPVIIEQVELIAALKSLVEVAFQTELSLSSEDFLRLLKEEIGTMGSGVNVPIHKIRDRITEKTGISREQFLAKLAECRATGQLRLIEGSPPSESGENWVELRGRRFYYLELVEE